MFLGVRLHLRLRNASVLAIEQKHIALAPEREVRQIFGLKGFSGGELERIADVITDDGSRRIWPFSNRKIASRLVIHFCNRSIRRRFCPTVRVGDLGLGGGIERRATRFLPNM
jgi:hypothetical protein